MKLCEYCRKPLVRKTRPDGRLENPKEYATRRYCNPACSNHAVGARRRAARGTAHAPDKTSKLFGTPKRKASYVEDSALEETYYGILKAEGEL